MNQSETAKLLESIESCFPASSPKDARAKGLKMVQWTIALSDFSLNGAMAAFSRYLQTNTSGFAPTPAQIIQIIVASNGNGDADPDAVLTEYRRCLSHCGYSVHDEETQKAFNSIPKELKDYVTIDSFWADSIEENLTAKNMRWTEIKKIVQTNNARSVENNLPLSSRQEAAMQMNSHKEIGHDAA